MNLKTTKEIGYFIVSDVEFLPWNQPRVYEEDEKKMFNLLKKDGRFKLVKGEHYGDSEVYIKEGTIVDTDFRTSGLNVIVGDFQFFIPREFYYIGDIIPC